MPIPMTCVHVTLHGKRILIDKIKLRILRWEDYPGLSESTQWNHQGTHAGGRRVRVRDVTTEAEVKEKEI